MIPFRTNKRQVALFAALLLTLAATAYVGLDERSAGTDPSMASVAPAAARHASRQREAGRSVATLPARNLPAAERDIFGVKKAPVPERAQAAASPPVVPSPLTAMIPPPLPPAPPVPVAPPLPFAYIGKLGEGGRYTVFLSARGRNYAVKAGDLAAQVYRVEEINPPTMTLIYLPMNIKQTMQIGEAN